MPPRKRRVTPEQEPELARNIPQFVTPVTAVSPEQIAVLAPPSSQSPSALDERRDRDLDELIDAIGSDGRLAVWHVIDGKAVFAGNMSLDGFSLDTLLEAFGGGDKSLVLYQGKTKVDTFRVSLDPTVPVRSPKAAKAIAAQATTAAPAPNGLALGDLSAFIAAMAQSQMASMNMFQTMQSQNQAAFAQVMQAMTTMIAAKPERDPLDLVTKVVGMVKDSNGANGTGTAKELLEFFERGMTMAEKIAPRDGDDVMGVVGKGIETLGVLIEGIVAEKKANAARIEAASPRQIAAGNPSGGNYVDGVSLGRPDTSGGGVDVAPATAPDASAPDHSDTSATDGEMTTAERPVWLPVGIDLGRILSAAQWLRPAEAASIIAGRLSDQQFDALISDIETPGFGERLPRYVPAVANMNPQWVGDVVSVLLNEYVEADEANPEDTAHDDQ